MANKKLNTKKKVCFEQKHLGFSYRLEIFGTSRFEKD
jgi:hypothetical protein